MGLGSLSSRFGVEMVDSGMQGDNKWELSMALGHPKRVNKQIRKICRPSSRGIAGLQPHASEGWGVGSDAVIVAGQ
jgi:hypothetical protein